MNIGTNGATSSQTSVTMNEGQPRTRDVLNSGDKEQMATAGDSNVEGEAGLATDITFDEVLAKAGPKFATPNDSCLAVSRFSGHFPDLVCPICRSVVDECVQSDCCQHVFCCRCIWLWLEHANNCPMCRQPILASKLGSPPLLVLRLLSQLECSCDFAEGNRGCRERVPLEKLQVHVQECPFGKPNPPPSLRKTLSGSSSVSDVLQASPSKLYGDVGQRLTRHLINTQAEGGRMEIGTGGRRQLWVRMTQGEASSESASSKTLQRRSQELQQARHIVCGGDKSAEAQAAADLRAVKGAKQRELLQKAGIVPAGATVSGTALALKADLSLPWYALRKLRLWLSSFGVQLESERVMRQQIAAELPFELECEEVPMSERSGRISLAPLVRFPNLVQVIIHFLNEHNQAKSLTWHAGMAENEIWLKLGGNHGGGSFKLSFQIANVTHPNSTKNTIPLVVFGAKDYVSNLRTALGPYAEQVKSLRAREWCGKQIRVIFFGDYELQCALYGISGASGTHPCLFCNATKKQMQLCLASQPAFQERTLATLQAEYEKFTDAGSVLSRAKEFCNVIRPYMLPIPLEDVCLPALHLDLGIFPWLYEAMLADAKQLDCQLAAKVGCAGILVSDSEQFSEAAKLGSTLAEKKQNQVELEQQVSLIEQQVKHCYYLFT